MRKWLWVALTPGNEDFFVFQASTGALEHSGALQSCFCLPGPNAQSVPAAGSRAGFLTVPFIYLPHVMLFAFPVPGRAVPCREDAGGAGGAAGSSSSDEAEPRAAASFIALRSALRSPPPGRLLSTFSLPFPPPPAQPGQQNEKKEN